MNIPAYSNELIMEMSRYYDARAPWHDGYMGYKTLNGMERLLKPIIESVAKITADKNVIEIACGTGNWTQVLGKRANNVTAVDISSKALEIARKKLRDFKNVSLIQDDAYRLNKIDNVFDVAFASDWFSHIPLGVMPAFLNSVRSKLNSKSKAAFIDMSFKEFFKQETCYYDSDGNRISLRALPDGSEFRVVKNFPDRAELEQILSPYTNRIEYREFKKLQRWMVVFTFE